MDLSLDNIIQAEAEGAVPEQHLLKELNPSHKRVLTSINCLKLSYITSQKPIAVIGGFFPPVEQTPKTANGNSVNDHVFIFFILHLRQNPGFFPPKKEGSLRLSLQAHSHIKS